MLPGHPSTTWLLDERIGVDIRLRKASPNQRWPQLEMHAEAVLPPSVFQPGGALARPRDGADPPPPECRRGRSRSARCAEVQARLDTWHVLYAEEGGRTCLC